MSNKAEDILLASQAAMLNDKEAFNRLVQKYQSSIRRFFLNLTVGDTALSDDLAQETFIKVYLNLRSFQGISSFSTWLFRIAYNTFYDSKRAQKYYEDLDVTDFDKKNSISNEYSPEKNDIFVALKLLKKEEQTAVLLFYMEDKTQKEIAKIMDIPLGTVKTYLMKGKEKMTKFLTVQGYGK